MQENLINEFNKQAIAFFEELQYALPNEPAIGKYKVLMGSMILLNKKKPYIIFLKSLRPHGDEIRSKNEDFFKNVVSSKDGDENLVFCLEILEKHWYGLSEINKKNIWVYLQVLHLLGSQIDSELNNTK